MPSRFSAYVTSPCVCQNISLIVERLKFCNKESERKKANGRKRTEEIRLETKASGHHKTPHTPYPTPPQQKRYRGTSGDKPSCM